MTDIAIFIPSLNGGGAERVMVTLANGFMARGFSVDLVLTSKQGPYLKEVSAGVRVIDLGARHVTTGLPALVRYLRRVRPTAMLSALNYANVVAVVARLLARVPTRLVVSERANLSGSQRNARGMRARLLPLLMHLTYPKADAVVAVSAGVADDLARVIGLARDRIGVVYNPVITESLFVQAKQPVDHPWLVQGQPPVILGVGRLSEEKDFPTLIRAFARVRQEMPCRLVILGEGAARPELEHLIDELGVTGDVLLPGFVSNPYAWMSKVRIFVLSSIWEGLPGALIQAMACGVAVISTDCQSGPREILDSGRIARLIPIRNDEVMASAVREALTRTESNNGLYDMSQLMQRFGSNSVLRQYLNILTNKTQT